MFCTSYPKKMFMFSEWRCPWSTEKTFYHMSLDGFYEFVQSARRQPWRGNSSTCPPELQIPKLPLLFGIWPLSVSNEELIPGICPLGIRNLPAWYQEIALFFFFFRDSCWIAVFHSSPMACPKQGEQKRQHWVHESTTRQEHSTSGSDDETHFRKSRS